MSITSIAIIGYGRFGRLLEQLLPVVYVDADIRCVKRDIEKAKGADIIIPAVPVRELESVITSLAPLLKEKAIVMDVSSVKIYPKQIMLKNLPGYVQIVATHPMFGPGTLAKRNGDLKGLKIVVDAVRISRDDKEQLLHPLKFKGLDIVEMSSEDHDRYAAQFHFSSQYIASVIKELGIERTSIDTASVAVLHEFGEFVQTDTIALLQDMYRYNPYCKEQLQKIQSTVEHIAASIQS